MIINGLKNNLLLFCLCLFGCTVPSENKCNKDCYEENSFGESNLYLTLQKESKLSKEYFEGEYFFNMIDCGDFYYGGYFDEYLIYLIDAKQNGINIFVFKRIGDVVYRYDKKIDDINKIFINSGVKLNDINIVKCMSENVSSLCNLKKFNLLKLEWLNKIDSSKKNINTAKYDDPFRLLFYWNGSSHLFYSNIHPPNISYNTLDSIITLIK